MNISKSEKAAFRIGFSHLIQALFGFLRLKVLTNFLGPSGYALYALLVSNVTVTTALSKGAIEFITVRRFSSFQNFQFKNKLNSFNRILKVSFIYSLVSCFFQLPISYYVFIRYDEITLYILSSLIFVFFVVNGSFVMALMQGIQEFRIYAKTYLISSIVGSCIQILCVLSFSKYQAPIAIALAAFSQFLIQFYSLRIIQRKFNFKFKRKIKISKGYLKIISINGAAKASSASLVMLSQFIIILFLTANASNLNVASYFAFNGITIQVSALVMIGVSSAFFPNLVSIYKNNRISFEKEVYSQTSFISFILFPFVIFLILYEKEIIRLLLNEDYILGNNLFGFMAVSTYGASMKQSFDLSLFCNEKNKYFLNTTFFSSVLLVLSVVIGFYSSGINGMAWGLIFHSYITGIVIIITSLIIYKFQVKILKFAVLFLLLSLSLIISMISDSISLIFSIIIFVISVLVSVFFFYKRNLI